MDNKAYREEQQNLLQNNILSQSNKFWLPKNNNKINIASHSWFDIKEIHAKQKNKKFNAKLKISKLKSMTKCEKIKMYPTKTQRIILLNWMNAYVRMYNETLKLFKHRKINKLPTIVSWKTLRTSYLKNIKSIIIKSSNLKHLNYKTQVASHVLDGAIQDACAKLKSCITNLKRRNIKHFRLRYLKQSKSTKIIKIEKYYISPKKNTFHSSIFKDSFILKKNDKNKTNFKLEEIKKDFTIHYNNKLNKFTLLNPIEIHQTKLHKNKDTIALDPGIRSFQTGYSNNKCVEIGNNLKQKVKYYLNKIDNINNSDTNMRIKKKVGKKCYKKIQNIIDDLHWKSINYLTENYGNILIGNLSTKSIVNNNSKSNLDTYTKQIGLLMRLYKYKQRLEFKCTQRKIGYMEIDESYTSKTCTNCGYIKNNLGQSKTFNCNVCKISIGRDINGARNILLKSL